MKVKVIFEIEKITEDHRPTTKEDIKKFYPNATGQEIKELLKVFTTYNTKENTIGG